MKHLKKHPKQQRMEDMVTPDGKFVHKSIKKRNKLIARALDGKKPLDLSGGVHKSKGRPLTISDVDMAHKEYQKHGAISGFPTWYPKEDKTFPLQKNKPSPVFVRMGDKIIPYRGKSGNKKGTNIVSNKSPDIDIFVDTNLDSHTYINNKKVTFPNLNDFGFAVAVRKLLDEGTKPEKDMTFPLHKPGNCFYHPKELAVVNSETDAYELGITYFGLCQNCIRTRFDGEKVTWEGREWLRSINDDNGFTLLPRIVWRVVAVGVLVGAVIYFLSKAL